MIRWSVVVFALLLIGCAQPVAPSGGPVDKTPPALIHMYPPSNSVDFNGRLIRFEFSEGVDRASFERALTIVPELSTAPKLRWKGRTVEIILQDSLSPATTYVFTIDNSLRDQRNVSLREPIVRAIATGSAIDDRVLSGRLLDPRSGTPVPGIDVFATRADTVESGTPAIHYRTQTGPQGTFSLQFLPSAPFALRAFEDRNRNRVRDETEQFAVAPKAEFVPSAADSSADTGDWWVVDPDTSGPSLLGVTARSSRRIELRYSEPVRLDTLAPGEWVLKDSISGAPVSVSGLYVGPDERRRVVLVTADSLSLSTYRMEAFGVVRDSSGNTAEARPLSFTGVATVDTMRLRFLGFDPGDNRAGGPIPMTGRQDPGLRFNRYVSPVLLAEEVTAVDTAGNVRSLVPRSTDGTLWRLDLSPELQPGETVTVSVAGSLISVDSTIAADFRRLSSDETGSLTGYVVSDDDVVVELYAQRGRKTQLETVRRTKGDYTFADLAVGNYKLRMFADRDGDGAWDWGSIDPYERPERLQWYADSARARAGWETVLDTLRFKPSDGD